MATVTEHHHNKYCYIYKIITVSTAAFFNCLTNVSHCIHFKKKLMVAVWHFAKHDWYIWQSRIFHDHCKFWLLNLDTAGSKTYKNIQSIINSLWPSDAIWHHRAEKATSHYLNQWWLIINCIPGPNLREILNRNTRFIQDNELKYVCKMTAICAGLNVWIHGSLETSPLSAGSDLIQWI